MRFVDVQRELYADTVAAYTKALQLTQAQYRAGVTLRSDVALAETQLKSAQAAAVDLDAQRAAARARDRDPHRPRAGDLRAAAARTCRPRDGTPAGDPERAALRTCSSGGPTSQRRNVA